MQVYSNYGTEMKDTLLIASVDANPNGVRWAMIQLVKRLTAKNYGDELLQKCELVLAEVLNNVVEHALAGQAQQKIFLHVTTTPKSLECEIVDRGISMPEGKLPDGHIPQHNSPMEDLPEGGFGWYLIRSQTDTLSYERQNGQNILRCAFIL